MKVKLKGRATVPPDINIRLKLAGKSANKLEAQ